eukprot:TCALIF_10908-PA protein Name:"Similar to Carboxypeptidase B (Astacus astacus)" AED:0.19 eAED:0.19 QI:25/0.85/0.75/1/1/1/8/52/400
MRVQTGVSFLFALVLACQAKKDYSGYQVLTTGKLSPVQVDALRNLQTSDERFDFWKEAHPDGAADVMSSADHLTALKEFLTKHNIDYSVKIQDVGEAIQISEKPSPTKKSNPNARYNLNWDEYGSHDDFNEFIEEIASQNSWASVRSIGKSVEGRDMKVLELTKGGSGAPNIFIEAGIHAREWIAPAVATYTVKELVENYDSHPEYLDNFNFYVLPCANPDGYEYSRSTVSVDLNRNWEFHWAESGVSDSPCSDVFCGYTPTSEIESQNIKAFYSTLSPVPELTVCFHSAANLWLYPYGYAYDSYPDNVDEIRRLGEDAVDALNAVNGQSFECINSAELYPAAGASDDYYASLGSRFVYTPELRDNGFGFVLPPEYIIPSGEEVWAAWKVMLDKIMPNKE